MSAPEVAPSPDDEENPKEASVAEKLERLAFLDLGEFRAYAHYVSRKFAGKVRDMDGEDVMHQAVVRVLQSKKKDTGLSWHPKKVDFAGFFRGVIRSTASNLYRSAKEKEWVPPDELRSPATYDVQLDAATKFERITGLLSGRPHALEILDLRADGRTAKEIQERLGISADVYYAADKWIKRVLKRISDE